MKYKKYPGTGARIIKNWNRAFDEDEWLVLRKGGIGGSESGGVCGVSPYQSPLSVYLDKTGMQDGTCKKNDRIAAGNIFEKSIITFFEHKTRYTVKTPRILFCHDEHDFIRVTLDGLVYDGKTLIGVVECKFPHYRTYLSWDNTIPEYYLCQCHHEMLVTGLDRVFFVVLNGNDLDIRVIHRDENIINNMIRTYITFWYMVQNRIEPKAQYNDIHRLNKRYIRSNKAVTLPDTLIDTIGEYETIQDIIKKQKKRLDNVKARLIQHMGDAEIAHCKHAVITNKANKEFDETLVQTQYPEMYTQYTREIFDKHAFKQEHTDVYHKCRKSGSKRFAIKLSNKQGA